MTQVRASAEKFRIMAAAQGGAETVVEVFDVLDSWWGDGLNSLKYQLRDAGGPIRVLLNSPGGDLTEAVAIASYLQGRPGQVTVEVLGLAASAASILAVSADRVEMHAGSFMMVHNPWNIVQGNADDMTAMADTLRTVQSSMVDTYLYSMKRRKKMAGMTDDAAREQIQSWLDAETWMTAEQAVAAGFADAVIGYGSEDTAGAAIQNSATAGAIKAYKHTPERVLNLITNMDKNEKKGPLAALVSGLKNLVSAAESVDAAAAPETEATAADAAPTESATPEADPIEAAKKLLADAGYTVADATAEEAATETDAAPAAQPAAKADDIEARIQAAVEKAKADMKAEAARKAAGTNPAAPAASTPPTNAKGRAEAIRSKALAKFANLAEAVQGKD